MEKFYMSVDSFLFYRQYTYYHLLGHGEVLDSIQQTARRRAAPKFALLSLFFVFIGILMSVTQAEPFPKQNTYRFYLSLVSLFLLVAFFISPVFNRRKQAKNSAHYFQWPASFKGKILYYIVSDDGLYINLFNRENIDEMVFIPWDKVTRGGIQPMELRTFITGSRAALLRKVKRRVKEVQRRYPNQTFDPDIALTFEDREQITLYTETNRERIGGTLPMPKEWERSSEKDHFIRMVQQYIPIT